MNYLIDTCVISELVKKEPNVNVINWFKKIPDENLYLSVLSFGEIRKGIGKIIDHKQKEKLRIWLEHELTSWFNDKLLSIDVHVSDCWGRLQAEMQKPLPAIDSLIAATALHYDLTLVTRNLKDFYYPALSFINPWE